MGEALQHETAMVTARAAIRRQLELTDRAGIRRGRPILKARGSVLLAYIIRHGGKVYLGRREYEELDLQGVPAFSIDYLLDEMAHIGLLRVAVVGELLVAEIAGMKSAKEEHCT